MDVLILIIGIVLIAAMFAVVGSAMFRADQSGARGILRAWGRPDRFISGEDESTRRDDVE